MIKNLFKIKFLVITILFWPLLALSAASTSASLTTSQTSTSTIPAPCLTQITAFATPNPGGTNASACGNGQWCTSESTYPLTTLASTSKSGLMCPGTYAIDFAGCQTYSAGGCGGGSCSWGASVKATVIAGSCGGANTLATQNYWMGTSGLSQSHYNPNENVVTFIYFTPTNWTYDTGMSNLYFTSGMDDNSNGTLMWCVISMHRTSTYVPIRQSVSCY